MAALCIRCGKRTKSRKERFCQACGEFVKQQMIDNGYIDTSPPPTVFRDDHGRKGLRDLRMLGGVAEGADEAE
uniref:Uncharacterized protein n=1 Tax=viral metagenome TaxID=1070528 RepID=A0A6M3JG84_9ZZZZ